MCQDLNARIIIKQGSGVPTIPASTDHRNGDWIATDIYEGELYLDNDTGLTYTSNGGVIQMANGRKKQLVWEALLTQTGTNAPVLTITQNDIGITGVSVYSGVGSYTITGFVTLLTGNIKIDAFCTNGQIQCSAASSSILSIATDDNVGVSQNGILLLGSYVRVTFY
jgi:hypothetical protein